MRYRKTSTVLAIVLAVSLIVNIVVIARALTKPREPIIGTFCSGDASLPGGRYLVFQPDKTFVLYEQLNLLYTGTYETSDDTTYSLYPDGEAEPFSAVFDSESCVYLFMPGSGVLTYERIDREPVFINLPDYSPAISPA